MLDILQAIMLVLLGTFLFGILIFVFYMGLKPEKKIPADPEKKKINHRKPRIKLT